MLTKVTFRATFIALCTMLSAGAYAIADTPRRVDIPAGELSVALLKLSKQYGADLVYRPEQVYGVKTHGAHGSFTTEQAARQLLQGTVLELRTDQSGAMLIAPPASGSAQATGSATQASAAPPQDATDASKGGEKNSSSGFRVAQVDQGKNAIVSPIGGNSSENSNSSSTALSEIIVTAQKKSERLQDVPVPVTVLSANTLVERNQVSLSDYFSSVPGLNFQSGFQGAPVVSVRGINTGLNPTMAMTIDDVPFGSSLFRSGGALYPDLDPNDLARIEILRGPQGTLYGVNTLGGLIKYVTVDPSTDRFSGYVRTGLEGISGGHEVGYNVSGGINVPLSDTLAVRASGFTRTQPGYVDNPGNNQNDVNSQDTSGGLIAAKWMPSDNFSAKVSALYQKQNIDGSSRIDPTLGDLQQTYLKGAGTSKITRQA